MNYYDKDKKKYAFLKSKYVDKIPVLVNCSFLKDTKYLVPDDFTFSQLLFFLRRRVPDLKPSEAIYMYVKKNNEYVIPVIHDKVTKYEKGDYVHIDLKKENTFG